jgi:hypothetical protein
MNDLNHDERSVQEAQRKAAATPQQHLSVSVALMEIIEDDPTQEGCS